MKRTAEDLSPEPKPKRKEAKPEPEADDREPETVDSGPLTMPCPYCAEEEPDFRKEAAWKNWNFQTSEHCTKEECVKRFVNKWGMLPQGHPDRRVWEGLNHWVIDIYQDMLEHGRGWESTAEIIMSCPRMKLLEKREWRKHRCPNCLCECYKDTRLKIFVREQDELKEGLRIKYPGLKAGTESPVHSPAESFEETSSSPE